MVLEARVDDEIRKGKSRIFEVFRRSVEKVKEEKEEGILARSRLGSLDVSYWWTKLAFGNKEGEIVYLLKAISSSHSCLVKPLREMVKVNVFNHSLLYQHDYP
jgi:hypothetical protein